MHTLDPSTCPKLRTGLAAEPHKDNTFVLHDPLGIGRPVILSPLAIEAAERFDGESSIVAITEEMKLTFPGAQVSVEAIVGLVVALDGANLLDSQRLRSLFDGPVRKPTCVGTYAGEAGELRAQLTHLFTAPEGPGMPGVSVAKPDRALRAVLVPHMDYGRGGVTYGHGFKELLENTDARVFVIVATSHYSAHRFTLSRQHFDTPLGLVETDQEYVNRIAEHYGEGLFDDPLAHVPEHSIELEVVLLKFLLADRRPFKIVPLLTGSIHDCVHRNSNPEETADLVRMVAALRTAEAACKEPVCYVISGDLAHIGPKFGDSQKAAGPWLEDSRAKDGEILKSLETASPSAFFNGIAADQNSRRICGLSPAWLTLGVTQPRSGKVLHYQQFVHPEGKESVSFASVAFYG
jgi:AmmeMemoRadiSam system protein B